MYVLVCCLQLLDWVEQIQVYIEINPREIFFCDDVVFRLIQYQGNVMTYFHYKNPYLCQDKSLKKVQIKFDNI